MNMHWIDWSIVAALLVILTVAAVFTRKYTTSVADFLAANRCAGRYLITISSGIAGVGAISIVAGFEMYYKAGFTAAWWQLIMLMVTAIVYLSGWVIYRFRQTRALTMAQFLEVRYSKKFRIFAGLLSWFSGIINFGIFPSVGARFFMYFCGLGDSLAVYILIMLILLAFALFFTFMGGQIAVIITDFIQGTFCNIMFIVIIFTVLLMFNWSEIAAALTTAPEGASLIHPFKTAQAEDFNIWYYLMMALIVFYSSMTWQGSQGYHVSALNAHEARMGKVLGTWRLLPINLFMMLLPVCAYVFMHHTNYADQAQNVTTILADIGAKNSQIANQMTTPIAISSFLPVGIIGGLAAVMLAAFISTHDTYMHSWGSIFIQDVIMPFRKKPFTPKQHMFLLRCSIFGVTVFIFCFSLLFKQTEYILMFFEITGAIFTAGAGAVVIGGLYWKRGTTAGAWAALITGATLAVTGVIIRQIHADTPFTGTVMAFIASKNGVVMAFYSSVIAIIVYILFSLLGRKTNFNMDKMLHRGKYAVTEHVTAGTTEKIKKWRKLIGMGKDFNTKDKVIYLASLAWTVIWIGILIFGIAYNFLFKVSTETWSTFWKYYVWGMLITSAITTVWFTIGGLCDIKKMFSLLGKIQRNDLDDGMVTDHHNAGEESENDGL